MTSTEVLLQDPLPGEVKTLRLSVAQEGATKEEVFGQTDATAGGNKYSFTHQEIIWTDGQSDFILKGITDTDPHIGTVYIGDVGKLLVCAFAASPVRHIQNSVSS